MKHLLSATIIIAFFLIAMASKVSKVNADSFNTNVRPDTRKGTYVIMNDGSRVSGKEINTGGLTNNIIKIDGQKISAKDVRGFVEDGVYYVRYDRQYLKCIIPPGKVRVYLHHSTSPSTNADGRSVRAPHNTLFYQIGETGDILPLKGKEGILAVVADCPKAVQMANLSDSDLRKAIKQDDNYLNSIFEVYNNGCK